ncbi:cupin domain-containing protein [Labrenzia sp. 011]|uniref:cupin domain-containing protein n=1 Tax=Labrenzia sp. 011 TaxID=2171494 RepID=UPI000D521D57|nr:cupin domain-containing protein [Labrenzia sp. 011]PVB61127.1 cupin [Labrenzia sp. 011]
MPASPPMSAEQVVALLRMQPHPEGGFYAETFRDEKTDGTGRAASTLIYFLLPEGVLSRWHRVDAVETWHWYAGAPLELSISPDGRERQIHTLGNDLIAGQRPQGIVPRDGWQQARSLGSWTLVGCTVAPGFRFEGFEMAPEGWEPGGASA